METPDDLLALVAEVQKHETPAMGETPEGREAREDAYWQAEENLVRNRLTVVDKDVDHKEAKLYLSDPTNPDRVTCKIVESYYLWGQQSSGRDADGDPVWNKIHKALEAFYAFGIQGIPRCSLKARAREIDGPWNPDILAFYAREARETTDRINRLVTSDFDRNQYPDLRDQVVKDAAIAGFGAVRFDDDEVLDMRDPRVNRLRRDRLAVGRSARRRQILERIKGETRMRREHPSDVVFQAGVASAYGQNADQEMLRVSTVHIRDTEDLRRQNPGKEINSYGGRGYQRYRKGRGASGGRTTNGAEDLRRGTATSTAVVTTWEVVRRRTNVVTQETMVGEDGMPYTAVHRDVEETAVMVKTVIAGDTLLSVRTWTQDERAMDLPVVPVYMKEHPNHPYGYSMAMLLKRSQDLINKYRLMVFTQGAKAISNQSTFLDGRFLGPEDDPDAITEGMRNGDTIVIHGNQDEDDPLAMRQHAFDKLLVSPAASAMGGITAALGQIIQMEEASFQGMSEMVDVAEMTRARTGLGKQKAKEINDQSKTSVYSLLARFVERLYELGARNWWRIEDDQVVPVESGYVRVNEVVRETVRRFGPDEQPLKNPYYDPELAAMYEAAAIPVPPEMTQEFLTMEVEGLFGNTWADVTANADTRTWLPTDPMLRLQALASLAEGMEGLGLITNDTLRDEVLPEDLKARDDEHREKRAEDQRAMAQRAAQQGLAMAGAAPEGSPAWAQGAGQVMAGQIAREAPEIAAMSPAEVEAQLAAMGAGVAQFA